MLFFASWLCASRTAVADATGTRRAVDVTVVGSDEDAQTLEASLRELLARLEIQLVMHRADHLTGGVTPSPQGVEMIASVGVDLTTDPVHIAFRDPKTGRTLGERELAKSTTPSLTLEAVAHIVQSGVEDINAQAPPPPPKPEAPNPPPPIAIVPLPAPTPPSKDRAEPTRSTPRWGIDVGAFCDGNFMASNVGLVVGGGGSVSLAARRGNFRPALQISGSYHAPFDASDTYVSDRVRVLALRAVPTVQLSGGESWSLEAGAGGGIDTFFTSPGSTTVPGTLIQDSRTDIDPVVLALVAVHFAVASSANLFLSVSAPIDLAPHRYLDDVGGATNTVFLPARVRPAVAFGFEFTALGRAPYGPSARASK